MHKDNMYLLSVFHVHHPPPPPYLLSFIRKLGSCYLIGWYGPKHAEHSAADHVGIQYPTKAKKYLLKSMVEAPPTVVGTSPTAPYSILHLGHMCKQT